MTAPDTPRIDAFPITSDQIHHRVGEIGSRIVADLSSEIKSSIPLELTVVPILRGAFIFAADLIRALPHASPDGGEMVCRVEPVIARSYGDKNEPTEVELDWGLVEEPNISGRHVLLVDDILDTGRTISRIRAQIQNHGPKSVRTAVIVEKEKEHGSFSDIQADYCGFIIPDVWVVGYGMDDQGLYRGLPYIDIAPPR
jgi:hypoxanthine phosphoribosyltransferase